MENNQDKLSCLVVENEQETVSILEEFISQTPELHLSETCSTAEEASRILSQGNFDVLFLDSTLTDLATYELLRSLREKPKIVLTGPQDDLTSVSAHWEISDYLPKPLQYEHFVLSVEKLIEHFAGNVDESPEIGRFLYLKCDLRIHKIFLDEIHYFESLGDYIKIHTDNGRLTFLSTMKNLEKNLPANIFYRVHRGFIVNAHKVIAHGREFLEIPSRRIPVGNFFRDNMLSMSLRYQNIRTY